TYAFLFLIAVFIAAWKGGFGPGILSSLGTLILVPYLFTPGFNVKKIEIGRSALLLACFVLVSGMAHNRRPAEAALRQANEQLEERVQQRTQELSAAVTSLQTEMHDRQAAEQAVRESERRFRALIENSSDGLLLLDEKGRIKFSGPPILGF